MSNSNSFGRLIRSLRKERELTQVELAAAIGVGRSTIAAIETGHDMPGRETLAAIADFFRMPIDQLRHGMPSPGSPNKREVIDDPDELALLAFWRGLTDDQRLLMLRLLSVPERRDSAA